MNIKHTAKKQCIKNSTKNSTTDVGGSGDSPLFPGLPEQKPNIAEGNAFGNATWF
jgi:hypothetical protein